MIRTLLMLFLVTGLASASGCVMCAAPDDIAYSAYGGSWQRDDMVHGRVGSVLDPTGGPYLLTSSAEDPSTEEIPMAADEWQDDVEAVEDDDMLAPPPGAVGPSEELLPPSRQGQPPRPLPNEDAPATFAPTWGSYR